jgi:hypothetical protein
VNTSSDIAQVCAGLRPAATRQHTEGDAVDARRGADRERPAGDRPPLWCAHLIQIDPEL